MQRTPRMHHRASFAERWRHHARHHNDTTRAAPSSREERERKRDKEETVVLPIQKQQQQLLRSINDEAESNLLTTLVLVAPVHRPRRHSCIRPCARADSVPHCCSAARAHHAGESRGMAEAECERERA